MKSLPRVFMIGRLFPAVAALVVVCRICVPCAAMAQEHPAHEWGYSGSEGLCALGRPGTRVRHVQNRP